MIKQFKNENLLSNMKNKHQLIDGYSHTIGQIKAYVEYHAEQLTEEQLKDFANDIAESENAIKELEKLP